MSFLFHLGQGKRDRRRIPMRRQRIDPGTARIAQSQQLGDLVEGFAGRIVERGADVAIGKALALVADEIKMGMATGNDQGQRSAYPSAPASRCALTKQRGCDLPDD